MQLLLARLYPIPIDSRSHLLGNNLKHFLDNKESLCSRVIPPTLQSARPHSSDIPYAYPPYFIFNIISRLQSRAGPAYFSLWAPGATYFRSGVVFYSVLLRSPGARTLRTLPSGTSLGGALEMPLALFGWSRNLNK